VREDTGIIGADGAEKGAGEFGIEREEDSYTINDSSGGTVGAGASLKMG